MTERISPELAEALTELARKAANMYGAPEPEYITICTGDASMPEVNPRDTQFQGFAKLLYEELAQNAVTSKMPLSEVEAFKQQQYQLIARRAYDLVEHAFDEMPQDPTYATTEELMRGTPDLTEWPSTP